MKENKSNSRQIEENSLTALSFSHSGEFCALATKKSIKLKVYRVKDINNFNSWENLQEFSDQSQPISEIDWAKDDKIISGSHDRSVFIYRKIGNGVWQKMLVNIDIKLSILCIKWAPSGKKFALGASCNSLAYGFYNIESSCWTATSRDKFCKSPIISLSFHPSSNLVAIGSTDNSIKVISCSFKNSKDEFILKSDVEDKTYQGPFSSVDTLFEVLYTIEDVGGWVNHISWELNGTFLLVFPHSNHFKILDVVDNGGKVNAKEIDVKWNGLPFLSGYVSEKGILYAGGFNKKVAVFNRSSSTHNNILDGFSFVNYLENNEKSSVQKAKSGMVSERLAGIEKKNVADGPNHSEHVNPIKILLSPAKKYTVSYDINGVIHFWQ